MPLQFEDNGINVSIFQPQIQKWEGTDFETRSAVAVTPPGSNAPIYGVYWMKARADVDKAARIVTLNDITVTRANFPSAPNLQSSYLALIRKHVPRVSKTIALDHLEEIAFPPNEVALTIQILARRLALLPAESESGTEAGSEQYVPEPGVLVPRYRGCEAGHR